MYIINLWYVYIHIKASALQTNSLVLCWLRFEKVDGYHFWLARNRPKRRAWKSYYISGFWILNFYSIAIENNFKAKTDFVYYYISLIIISCTLPSDFPERNHYYTSKPFSNRTERIIINIQVYNKYYIKYKYYKYAFTYNLKYYYSIYINIYSLCRRLR